MLSLRFSQFVAVDKPVDKLVAHYKQMFHGKHCRAGWYWSELPLSWKYDSNGSRAHDAGTSPSKPTHSVVGNPSVLSAHGNSVVGRHDELIHGASDRAGHERSLGEGSAPDSELTA